uniref:Myb/SANT-like DNA-binding domain-containing protein n=1 Tax=Helianthus annuus TaxID=4232 RepID=A0A251VRU1_HELAN
MASSDDDFPLITATTADTTTTGHQSNPNFHRHQLAATAHLLSSQTNQITARPPAEATGEAYGDGAYCSQQITVAYRKDREEWSDTAIACLLDAYLDKFVQLNRGNLRGRDWEEVAVSVSERCEKQTKSVEQCKNKVDNLKKRYKLERHRMMNTVNANGGNVTSHWPWFKKMEQIVGNSLPLKTVLGEENSGSGMSSPGRQSNKRYVKVCSLLLF